MNKIYLSLIIALLLVLPLASASLGNFNPCDPVDVKTILNTSSVTLSTLNYPDGSLALSNKAMQNVAGKTWNYTFSNTCTIGTYNYDYFDAKGNTYVNNFSIGNGGITIPIFLFLGWALLFAFALYRHNEFLRLFSGFMAIVAGIYTMIYGLGNFADDYTRTIAYVSIGWGLISCFISVYQMYEDDNDGGYSDSNDEEE